MKCGWVSWVGEPLEESLLILGIAGGEEEFASGPGEFVAVSEVIPEVLDFLISAVEAVMRRGNGIS